MPPIIPSTMPLDDTDPENALTCISIIVAELCHQLSEYLWSTMPVASYSSGLCLAEFLPHAMSFINQTQLSPIQTLQHTQPILPEVILENREQVLNNVLFVCYMFTKNILYGGLVGSEIQSTDIRAMVKNIDPYNIWIRCSNTVMGFLKKISINKNLAWDPFPLLLIPTPQEVLDIASRLLEKAMNVNPALSYSTHVKNGKYIVRVREGEKSYYWSIHKKEVNALYNMLEDILEKPYETSDRQSDDQLSFDLDRLKNWVEYISTAVDPVTTTTPLTSSHQLKTLAPIINDRKMDPMINDVCTTMLTQLKRIIPSFEPPADTQSKCNHEFKSQLAAYEKTLQSNEPDKSPLVFKSGLKRKKENEIIKYAVNGVCFQFMETLISTTTNSNGETTDPSSVLQHELQCRKTLITILSILSLAVIPETTEDIKYTETDRRRGIALPTRI